MGDQANQERLNYAVQRARLGTKGPWVLRCAPGLARVLAAELTFRGLLSRKDPVSVLRQRNHDLIFIQKADPRGAWDLVRISEEVHYCLVYGRYKISRAQMDRLAAILRGQHKPFRLIVTGDGSHFSRQDTKRYLSRELERLKVQITEHAKTALYAFCIDEAYYICLLRNADADAPLRQERQEERRGALPPTIGAAMAFLGKPRDRDMIIDPVCGSGTLLAEANAYAPGARLIGIDLDPGALESARRNLCHVDHCDLIRADSTSTGFPPSSTTLCIGNLPFGKQFGSQKDNPALYKSLLSEMYRIGARPSWRAVLLTSDTEALDVAMMANPGLRVTRRLPVVIRGEKATLFLISPTTE